jgi:hypothetical protein
VAVGVGGQAEAEEGTQQAQPGAEEQVAMGWGDAIMLRGVGGGQQQQAAVVEEGEGGEEEGRAQVAWLEVPLRLFREEEEGD